MSRADCPCHQCQGVLDPPDEPLSDKDRAEMEDYMMSRAEDRAEQLRDQRMDWDDRFGWDY